MSKPEDLRSGAKQSLYFPDDVLAELRREARRLDRSLAWIIQRAWRVARPHIRALPSDPAVSSASTAP
jgi:uncharacterized small protein (TIGR04563 family)